MKNFCLLLFLILFSKVSSAQWNNPKFINTFRESMSKQLDNRFIMDSLSKKVFLDCYVSTFAGLFKTPNDVLSIGQDSLVKLEGNVIRNCINTEIDKFKIFYTKWEIIDKVSEGTYIISLAKQFVPDINRFKPEIQRWMVARTFALYKLYYPLGMPLKVPEHISNKIQGELLREAKVKGYN
jgi:hypothetical protein